jgi:hypothetical protein
MKKKLLVIVAACAVLWAVGSVVTPILKEHDENFPDAFNDVVLHERVATYATTHSVPDSGAGILALPHWVPEDATDITVKAQTDGNAKLLRFTLAKNPLKVTGEKACTQGAFNTDPSLRASWWPDGVGGTDGRPDCSDMYQFRAAVKGDQVYAWSNGDLTRE